MKRCLLFLKQFKLRCKSIIKSRLRHEELRQLIKTCLNYTNDEKIY